MTLLQNGAHGQVHIGIDEKDKADVKALCPFRNRKDTVVFSGEFKEVTCPKCRLAHKVG